MALVLVLTTMVEEKEVEKKEESRREGRGRAGCHRWNKLFARVVIMVIYRRGYYMHVM